MTDRHMTAKRLAKWDALCFEQLALRLKSNDHEPLRAEMSSANKTNSPPTVLGRILRSYYIVDNIKISYISIATVLTIELEFLLCASTVSYYIVKLEHPDSSAVC